MSHQEALTIVAPIVPERLASLQEVLRQISNDPGPNCYLPFAALPKCHFGRLFWWEGTRDLQGNPLDAALLMLSDTDGCADLHLQELVDAAGTGIDVVFSNCRDYPKTPVTKADRLRYLRKHRIRERAHYVHRPGRTVEQIRGEARLYAAIRAFVDRGQFEALAATEVRERVREFVRQDPKLAWALDAPAALELRHRLSETIDALARPLAVLALSPVLVPSALLAIGMVRLQEVSDHPPHVRPTTTHLHELTALEDFSAHNPYAAGGFVKPGVLRQVVLSSILKLVDYGVRHLFAEDSLAGVKTIHFARWIPLDGGRRMIFASNFDGNVESYNDDFINLLGWGLNLVFSNGQGYPKTSWLVVGGASREQEFKDHLRCRQIPTPYWYAAYPELTARNIEHNAVLRAGLRDSMTEEEAQAWLRLL